MGDLTKPVSTRKPAEWGSVVEGKEEEEGWVTVKEKWEDKVIYPADVEEWVPSIRKNQSQRTLTNAQKMYNDENDPKFDPENLEPELVRMKKRAEDSAKCSIWLEKKFEQYQSKEVSKSEAM